MKNIFYVSLVVLAISACKNNQSNEMAVPEATVYEVPELLSIAFDSLNKEVQVTGLVTHVCSHSGRRCFIEDTTGEHSIRVEATDSIGRFDRELMGSEITVTGFIKEERLSTDYINNWELELKEQGLKEAENDGESCAAELANINSMREWMKEHNTDYYSIFFIEGTSFTQNETPESI